MKVTEFLRHLEHEHEVIWSKLLAHEPNLQEIYAAAQRHRQEHLKELDEQRQEFWVLAEPMTHVHYAGPWVGPARAKAVAVGPRDVFL